MLVLFSGGLDSYIAYHYCKKEFGETPKTLYVDLRHRYAEIEKQAVKDLIPDTIIDRRLTLADWEEPDGNIPMRNAFLLMIGAKYDNELVLVVQRGEMDLPDRSFEFFEYMENLLTLLNDNYTRLLLPFSGWTKTQMVKWYLDSGLPTYKLFHTESCYSEPTNSGYFCGVCSACFRRWVAMSNNGLQEFYNVSPYEGPLVRGYIIKMKAGEYDPARIEETFQALTRAGVKI